MKYPLIKINIDDAQTLTQLYDVGDEVAERIVNYRQSNGFFNTPNDLAKVKGVSLHLAETLSSQISWELPSEVIEDSEVRLLPLSFVIFIYLLTIIIGGFFLFFSTSSRLNDSIATGYGIGIWIDFSILVSQISILASFLILTLTFAVKSKSSKKRIMSFFYLAVSLLIISSISTGLGNFFDYQLWGWDKFIHNTPAVVAFFVLTPFVIFLIFMGIGIRFPNLQENNIFSRLISLLLIITIGALITGELFLQIEAIYFRLIVIILGAFVTYLGFISLSKHLTITQILFSLIKVSDDKDMNESLAWLTWLNSRLPNTEDQKSLQSSLNQVYPDSKLKTFFSVLLIGIGGWIILEAIGAVIEWIIQKQLDKFFN